ncbi:glycosyltransferase family 9 protein [Hydrogenobacter hydrogenophilus]|uniref:ADP-heptose:LPS heptosyltransferase n=1 Tax=Hydrogenobacter hydrogenophilus TaxID=35835 RepID=A0A285PAE2_9AQUI|nr:glycosyltransferase family 9 protein [Hydrogenobacter hydrogenophilus]SNZ16831.1 ADP-heptose:LPS heptosyltransferase [Hydrogenobacter hydrogenophilus]
MILFYRRGGLGDTLLTFPVLEILKKRGERIFAVGNTDYLKIAKEVGWIDEMHYEIPEGSFSRVIKVSVDGNVKPFPERRIWIVDHYLESLGLKDNYSDTLYLKPIRDNPFKGKAVIHPSSGSKAKNPPIELFLRIEEYLKRHGYQVIYFVGEADEWVKDFVSEFYQSTDPLEIAKALKEARLFIGNDSGISHLASYVGVPTFVFYGPTDPIVWRPIGRKVFQISLNLYCSPCFPNTCRERPCLNVEELFKSFVRTFETLMLNY